MMTVRWVVLAAALAMLVAAVAPREAGAAVFCRNNKKGTVFVRDPACKSKETRLNLADFGAVGPPGAPGAPGVPGPPGPFPDVLPSGEQLTGVFALGGGASGSDLGITQISFAYPLASAPTVQVIGAGAPTPAGCTGDVNSPGAAAGNLCIFTGLVQNSGSLGTYEPVGGINGIASTFGIVLYVSSTSGGIFDYNGTWAVRAP